MLDIGFYLQGRQLTENSVILTCEVLMARRKNTKEELQRFVIYMVVPLFAVHSLSTIAIFFLVGGGHLKLSNGLLMSLLASTFGEAATVFVIISKYLFSNKAI